MFDWFWFVIGGLSGLVLGYILCAIGWLIQAVRKLRKHEEERKNSEGKEAKKSKKHKNYD